MTHSTLKVASLLTVVYVSGCQSQETSGKVSLLFVQEAKGGQLVPIEGDQAAYELRLVDPSTKVTYFSDRPVRMAGTMSAKDFISEWSPTGGSFYSDPPNAALTIENTPEVFVLELTDPSMEGSTLRYSARLLAPYSVVPKEFGAVSLFIDNLASGFNQVPIAGEGELPHGYDQVPIAGEGELPHRYDQVPIVGGQTPVHINQGSPWR